MILINESIKKSNERYKKENPPDFTTHLNYVICLNELSKNLSINCSLNFKKRIPEIDILHKKINLIKLTLKGLEAEYKTISDNSEYAVVCVSWISVKAYYLLYNIFLILKYLLTGNESAFNSSHKRILKEFKDRLTRGEIKFNKDEFNNLYLCEEVLRWKFKSGSNIKIINVDNKERFKQIIKKLANYIVEEFKRRQKIKNFRSKKNKRLIKNFLSKIQINICEFFYWYRIKANYRDLEYLNKNISDDKFASFYTSYYELTINFYKAFKDLINNLAKIRFGKYILECN